jgi:hypothetical protein
VKAPRKHVDSECWVLRPGWKLCARPGELGSWASALARELDFSPWNGQVGAVTTRDQGGSFRSYIQPGGTGQEAMNAHSFFRNFQGPVLTSHHH